MKNNLKIGDSVLVDIEPTTNKPPRWESGKIVYFNHNGDPVVEFDNTLIIGQTFGAFPAKLIKKR